MPNLCFGRQAVNEFFLLGRKRARKKQKANWQVSVTESPKKKNQSLDFQARVCFPTQISLSKSFIVWV